MKILLLSALIVALICAAFSPVLAQSGDFSTFNAEGDTRSAGGTTNPSKNGKGER